MNILFISIGELKTVYQSGIYTDLLRCFISEGNHVYIVTANETTTKSYSYYKENGADLVVVRTGLIQHTGLIRKGINTLLIEPRFLHAINKYFDVQFDLLLYPTPPTTFAGVVQRIKKRDNAKTYLLLKDIFPQNAVDLGMMSKTGPKSILYRYFRNKEKQLYAVSDRIGCMSQANVDYVLAHNTEIDPSTVEVCPNSIEVIDKSVDIATRKQIREKYGIPLDKKVFIYGGNLGKPQGIPFLIECLKKCQDIENAYFLIVGDGTEYGVLDNYVEQDKPANVKLMKRLPKDDYDTMVGACDVGLIFLDHRFTIPNFPSRLLAYMQAKLPVLAATDPNTDIGKVIMDGGFGWWCESNDAEKVKMLIQGAVATDNETAKYNGWEYLKRNYSAERSYDIIMKGLL